MSMKSACLGCQLANKIQSVHVVYEDDDVCCFLDIEPFNEGHTLIVPKKHFLDVEELDMKTANAIMVASMKISRAIKALYAPDGITVCQNGGTFNDLSHYHMHVIPRYEGQAFYHEEESENGKEKASLGVTKEKLMKQMEMMS
ncbi:HIT family protein [Pseudalkalibacillus sp. NRS-1564]|uniref:HIT family protein n=1 Tax=Pseudalkalibacillus sp. NRS-1564 TaxID=3233900 RepID=UPI003D2CF145